MAAQGVFLSVEGVEGVGKTTNIDFIHQWLLSKDLDVLLTREPGGTPLAEEIRQLLLAKREEPVDESAELLMVFAARAQHVAQKIRPALKRGQWVLSDRFTDATYAYQGHGRGLPMAKISQLESLVLEGIKPHTTFYLDLPVSVGLERARARGDLDRFESEQVSFFEAVREGYLERVKNDPARFVVIDASVTLPEVQAQIKEALEYLHKREFESLND